MKIYVVALIFSIAQLTQAMSEKDYFALLEQGISEEDVIAMLPTSSYTGNIDPVTQGNLAKRGVGDKMLKYMRCFAAPEIPDLSIREYLSDKNIDPVIDVPSYALKIFHAGLEYDDSKANQVRSVKSGRDFALLSARDWVLFSVAYTNRVITSRGKEIGVEYKDANMQRVVDPRVVNYYVQLFASCLRDTLLDNRQNENIEKKAIKIERNLDNLDEGIRIFIALLSNENGMTGMSSLAAWHECMSDFVNLMISKSADDGLNVTSTDFSKEMRKRLLAMLVRCNVPVNMVTLSVLPRDGEVTSDVKIINETDAAQAMLQITKNPQDADGFIKLGQAFSYGMRYDKLVKDDNLYESRIPQNSGKGNELWKEAIRLGGEDARKKINLLISANSAYQTLIKKGSSEDVLISLIESKISQDAIAKALTKALYTGSIDSATQDKLRAKGVGEKLLKYCRCFATLGLAVEIADQERAKKEEEQFTNMVTKGWPTPSQFTQDFGYPILFELYDDPFGVFDIEFNIDYFNKLGYSAVKFCYYVQDEGGKSEKVAAGAASHRVINLYAKLFADHIRKFCLDVYEINNLEHEGFIAHLDAGMQSFLRTFSDPNYSVD